MYYPEGTSTAMDLIPDLYQQVAGTKILLAVGGLDLHQATESQKGWWKPEIDRIYLIYDVYIYIYMTYG